MRKHHFFILSIILLTQCSSEGKIINNGQTIKKLEITEGSTIVCFGDSLTSGYGAESIEYSYPMIMQKLVNIPVINSGVNDDTTADGLERIRNDVLEHNPVIVIIGFGGNDVYGPQKLKTKDIENNFRQMIEMIGTENRKIYIARYFNNQMRFLDIFFNFDRMLKRIEKDYNVEIIYNIWEGIWGKKELKYNMNHPNSGGYEVMARNIFSAIRPVLEYHELIK